jgi:hypothetical protein
VRNYFIRKSRFGMVMSKIFLIPFYLQAIHIHLANGVNLKKKKKA